MATTSIALRSSPQSRYCSLKTFFAFLASSIQQDMSASFSPLRKDLRITKTDFYRLKWFRHRIIPKIWRWRLETIEDVRDYLVERAFGQERDMMVIENCTQRAKQDDYTFKRFSRHDVAIELMVNAQVKLSNAPNKPCSESVTEPMRNGPTLISR